MMLGQILGQVLHVQIEILLPVESQHLFHRFHRHALRARTPQTAVKQTVVAELAITLIPAPHLPGADTDDFRRLAQGNLLGHRSQNRFLNLHGPLHGRLPIENHACLRQAALPEVAPQKRTFHLLFPPDISCATDIAQIACYRLWPLPAMIRALPTMFAFSHLPRATEWGSYGENSWCATFRRHDS